LLEEEAARKAEAAWDRVRVGAELEGTVRSIREFGAFVDLGGIDGMVHVSEVSFSRVKHPGEVLAVGQVVRVKVLRIDEGKGGDGRRQVALSIRALAEDPWVSAASRFPAGSRAAGTVTRVEQYGAFVELAPGVEGLVHVSKMALDRRLSHARQAATVGQPLEVTVVQVDADARRLSLSMVEGEKQAREREEAEDRKDQERVLAEQSARGSLGTLGDLLAAARDKKS
jgi:small subunit ribosomal protein S1